MVPLNTFLSLMLLGGALFGRIALAAVDPRTLQSNIPSTIPGAYIVEFANSHDPDSFYNGLGNVAIPVTHRMNMTYSLFNGTSFHLKDLVGATDIISRIAAMPAVKQIWPINLYSRPNDTLVSGGRFTPSAGSTSTMKKRQTPFVNSTDTFSPHVMTQVDKLHAKGFNGTGVKIGIVDTGVDYLHPALGGCFGPTPGCVVQYGHDLVGDDFYGSNAPDPDADPYDPCDGHGTHVTGIIAAQPNEYNFTGAAFGATIGMYRVFGCGGHTAEDVLIAAFNAAYEDGSDIISSSIGGISGWSENPWSSAVQRIVDKGVPCTLSAGNYGALGLFTASSAADGKGVTSVASFDNIITPVLLVEGVYTTANSSAATPFGWQTAYPPFETNISQPLWAVSDNATNAADACYDLPTDTPDLSSYIILIRRGGCPYTTKARNVAKYGASNILFYANNTEIPYIFVDPEEVPEIEGVGMTTAEQGADFVNLLSTGAEVILTITDYFLSSGFVYAEMPNTETGGFASPFTSWGPTWELDVYPDVGAPGGNILSTFLLDAGGYAVLSGTSMAAPITAAIYALVGEVRGSFDPTTLGSIITSTSKANWWNNAVFDLQTGDYKSNISYGTLAPVPQQGPGLIQAYDAAFVSTILSVQSIAFNDTDNFVSSVSFTIQNTGDFTAVYTIGHVPALTMYPTNEEGTLDYIPNPSVSATASLDISETTIKIEAYDSAEVTVTATPPLGVNATRLPVYSGYIIINGTQGDALTIPYLGVVGSMYNTPTLDPSTNYMANLTAFDFGTGPEPVAANDVFVLPYPTLEETWEPSLGIGYPLVLFDTNIGTQVLRMDVVVLDESYSGNTSMVLGVNIAGGVYGFPREYFPRESYWAVFTGMFADESILEEAEYVSVLVRALRIFGDPENPADYWNVTMVPFRVRYEYSNSSVSG